MKVRNIMSKSVEQTVAEATLFEAAGMMASLDVGILPVFDEDRLVGVITDRDIVTRAVAKGLDPSETTVRAAMTEEIVSCHPGDSLADAARLMEQHQVRRLLVLGDEGNVVGICSLADLIRRAAESRLAAEVMQEVVQPRIASHR